jgi:hypothetical protein
MAAKLVGMVLATQHRMTRFSSFLAAALTLAAIGAAAPARADFYSLEGRFQCLDQPGAVCYDATPSRAPTPPAAPAPKPAAAMQTRDAPPPAPKPVPTPVSAPAAAANAPAPPRRRMDPILAVAARIKADRPAAGDLDALRRAAAADDPRAIELLAWCALRGIGTTRNPAAAYFLYGEAAANDVPHARANQAAVYERLLTPDERQHVLDIAATPESAQLVKDFLLSADGLTSGAPDAP